MEGTKIGGKNVNNIKYVDDMVLIEDSKMKLQELVSNLDEKCRRIGLKVNIGKTRVMGVTKASGRLPANIRIYDEALKQVSKFRYLGSMVEENSKCVAEIELTFSNLQGSIRPTGFGKHMSHSLQVHTSTGTY